MVGSSRPGKMRSEEYNLTNEDGSLSTLLTIFFPKSNHATLGHRYSTARICARIRLDDSANPPNGSWGIVKVQPQSLIAVGEGRALTIPQLPLGGLGESSFVGVGRALTIPQLPLGGFGPCSSPLSWRTCARYCTNLARFDLEGPLITQRAFLKELNMTSPETLRR